MPFFYCNMASEDPTNKKLRDDTTFVKVNSVITLQKDEIKKNNALLHEVIESIVGLLKNDSVFEKIFSTTMYGGSFYKGTKVGKPEEYDLNFILSLPVDVSKLKIENGRPGFAKIRLPEESLSPIWTQNKVLNKWRDCDGYLDNEKVRSWFEGIQKKAFDTLEKGFENTHIIHSKTSRGKYNVSMRKSGPAFTLIVAQEKTKFCVDLVTVLEFNTSPPLPIFKKYSDQTNWYLVPKPIKNGPTPHRDWRYCFYTYENKMLRKVGKIKPIIRQLKKLRDTQQWTILCSYYIETLFFHELHNNRLNETFVNGSSQTILFMHMLKKLHEACKNKTLKFFWDNRLNLFEEITEKQMSNVINRLDRIIKDIEIQPSTITNYILTKEEQKVTEPEISKKNLSQLSNSKVSESNLIKDNVPKVGAESQKRKNELQLKKLDAVDTGNDVESLKQMVLSLKSEVKYLRGVIVTLTDKIDHMENKIQLVLKQSDNSTSTETRNSLELKVKLVNGVL